MRLLGADMMMTRITNYALSTSIKKKSKSSFFITSEAKHFNYFLQHPGLEQRCQKEDYQKVASSGPDHDKAATTVSSRVTDSNKSKSS
mmetsp:Transcript_6515/g.17468  ORF Transcript_6515/g.17468 Transcript_6515/m.17468 type:complete len:88 (-) Transcript_6515:125-388(-)